MGRKPNTFKSAMIEKFILEKDPQIEIEPKDYSEEADSSIMMRDRVRGTKLEGSFRKVKGLIANRIKAGKSLLSSRGMLQTHPVEKKPQCSERPDT